MRPETRPSFRREWRTEVVVLDPAADLRRLDEGYMRHAIVEARCALEEGETPVGAVMVHGDRIVARDHNRVEQLTDPTAHAEILVIGAAASALGDWRLNEVTLYVTMEPCTMCAGALLLGRVGRIVYGVRDLRAGACGSRLDLLQGNPHGHLPRLDDGCLQDECLELLQAFYRELRGRGDGPGHSG
jgi:tRNA(adenine34) deaminase